MKILDRYSRFISHHPYMVIAIIIILCAFSMYLSKNIKNVSQDNRDMLPENIDAIDAFNIIEDSFGSSDSAMIAIEISPEYLSSNEGRDIRDPDIIRYIDLMTEMAATVENVGQATSPATVLRQANGGVLPKSRNEIRDLAERSPLMQGYISEDNTMALIKLKLGSNYEEEELFDDLTDAISHVDKPAGLIVSPAGDVMTGPVIIRSMGSDMAKTSMFSFAAIIIILLIMLRSVKYSAMPLVVIGVGITFAFGFIGLMGMNMTPSTSGVISMIMGIGIDFGIQTITRFRQELKAKKATPESAMTNTMNNVFMPMATTTIAALIGFKAMGMGELTFLAELGNMMSYGVAACFIAAITVLPAIMVAAEKLKSRLYFWR